MIELSKLKPDITLGRAFAIFVIIITFVYFAYKGTISPDKVDSYMGIVMGYMFAQSTKKGV